MLASKAFEGFLIAYQEPKFLRTDVAPSAACEPLKGSAGVGMCPCFASLTAEGLQGCGEAGSTGTACSRQRLSCSLLLE